MVRLIASRIAALTLMLTPALALAAPGPSVEASPAQQCSCESAQAAALSSPLAMRKDGPG